MGNVLRGFHKATTNDCIDYLDPIQLAVDGYTRHIQKSSGTLYIPQDINNLIHHYYNSNTKLYLVNVANEIYVSQIDYETHAIHNATQIQYQDPSTLEEKNYMDTGICLRHLNKSNDIIYKCGGLKYTEPEFWLAFGEYPTDSCLSITTDIHTPDMYRQIYCQIYHSEQRGIAYYMTMNMVYYQLVVIQNEAEIQVFMIFILQINTSTILIIAERFIIYWMISHIGPILR